MNLSLILFVVVDERSERERERQSRSQMRIVFLSLLLFSLFHSSSIVLYCIVLVRERK